MLICGLPSSQACEERQKAWKTAVDLAKDLDALLSVTRNVEILRERQESRKGFEKLTKVIDEITDWILSYRETTSGLSAANYGPGYNANGS